MSEAMPNGPPVIGINLRLRVVSESGVDMQQTY